MTGIQTTPVDVRAEPAVDGSRPFGAHLRMRWWKPLVLIAVLPLAQLILQVALYQVAGAIEGSDDPLSATITPLRFLAANLSIGATGLIAVVLLAWMAGVPWRSLLSSPRAFDVRRLRRYLAGAALLVGAGIGVVALVAPDAPGWTGFGISTTTIALLAVAVVTTPLQAAGEELLFRSTVLPAAASWVRAVRPALLVGLVVSGLGFAALHGSTDPWLFGYYAVFGVGAGLMAIISGGVEAPIAFHVANNVLFTTVNTVMADGEAFSLDRTTDTGDASLLILAVVNVAMVALVWVRERRGRAADDGPRRGASDVLDELKRRRAARRLRPGDGRPLQPFRWWQVLQRRRLFSLRLEAPDRQEVAYAVDVRYWGKEGGDDGTVHLYRDGRHHAQSTFPARFPVEGGTIEVARSTAGLRRAHYITAEGAEQQLVPDPASAVGRRLRFDREHPTASRWIGGLSVVVLVIGLGVNLVQIAEQVSEIPPLVERFGRFASPVRLPLWLNITLGVAAGAASTERALRLRYHWLLD